ncbi:MFS transporter [Elioraea sp.]|uniref:MFS transporter n=1 Tax=Elioraea sp. TaxID=2185103 RepID=UPI00307E909C
MTTDQNIDINTSRLPLAALTAASFALGTEAYVFAGHLEALVRDLDAGLAAGGLVAASFAITQAIAGPPLAALAGRVDRRSLILIGLGALAILNLLAGLVSTFAALIALRVLCGIAAALVGPTASAAAAMLVPPDRRGRAMAAVLAGMTLAFVLGIPMGSVIGAWGGWRACFAFAGLVALVAAIAVAALLPPLPGHGANRVARLASAFGPHVRGTLLLTLLGFAATSTVIAYVGPVAAHVADLHGSQVGALQALIGVGSIVGIAIGARFADRPDATAMIAASFAVSAVALSLYSVLPATGVSGVLLIALLASAMVACAAALFARTPVIQSRLVAGAPADAAVLLALNGSTVLVGQGLGAALGALTTAAFGLGALGFAASAVAAVGLTASFALSSPRGAEPRPRVAQPARDMAS